MSDQDPKPSVPDYSWQSSNAPYLNPVHYCDNMLATQIINVAFKLMANERELTRLEIARDLSSSTVLVEETKKCFSERRLLVQNLRTLAQGKVIK